MVSHQAEKPTQRPSVIAGLPALLLASLLVMAPIHNANATGASNQQQAVSIALQQNGGSGKVLSVDTVTKSDGSVEFAVKVLSSGRVRVFRIPKSS